MPGPLPSFEILFAYAHLVVANKPSGSLIHRGWDEPVE
jgi:hypothetical protein